MGSVNSPKAGYEINKTIYGDMYDLLEAIDTEPVDDIISYALANLSGYQGNIFPHQLAFDISVKKIVEKYHKPVNDGINMIKNIVLNCIEECVETRFKRYPNLKDETLNLLRQIIERNVKSTKDNMKCYLDAQQGFINIRHPGFLQEIYPYSHEIKFIPNGTIAPPNGYVGTNSETKSNFYLEPSGKKYGAKSSNEKLNKSVESLNGNKITNSWGIKKMFSSKTKIAESVKEDSMIQDQTDILHKMVKSYMKVINTAIIDMTPKYTIVNLIQGTIGYVQLEFEASIFERRESNEDKLFLLQTDEDEQAKISELVNMEVSIKKAIEIIKNVTLTM